MNLLIRQRGAIAAILLLVASSAGVPAVPGQDRIGTVTEERASSSLSPADTPNGDEIIAQLLEHNQLRDAQLEHYSVVRTYEVRNHDGKLSAQEVVRMDYYAPGTKTFQKTSEKGSGKVRHMVFDRLMESESETAAGREHHDSALTSANYTFTRIGEEDLGPYHCYVVRATPKRKDKYLFEGSIWIDAQDFAVVKIAGHPAKKPSFWINRADFVRQYQKIGEFWVPYRDETIVHVRLFGKKLFTIDHEEYSINAGEDVSRDFRSNMK
jgi:outer membrane lipoprotein-sorting protein